MLLRLGRMSIVLVATLIALASAAAASAAESVYWGSKEGKLLVGGTGGEAAGAPKTLFEGEQDVDGIALDPATGKAYWSDEETSEIMVGGLGGEAEGKAKALYTGQAYPIGIAIDPAAGKLYWADEESGEIMVGGLGGEAEGQTATALFSSQELPSGIAIDPAAGKLYWADAGAGAKSGEIMVGGLGGEAEGGGEAKALYTSQEGPEDVAVAPAAGKLYWTDIGSGEVMVGGLGGEAEGGGEATALFSGQADPGGIAIDPAAGKLYWADAGAGAKSGEIMVGGLGGEPEDKATALFEKQMEPLLLVLLDAPVGAGAPGVTGNATAGEPLSCSTGNWGSDLPESLLYRAPQTFAYQWLREGAPVSGANAASFTPSQAGSYACEVTASNAAGSTTQTSAATTVKTPVVICADALAGAPLCPCGASCPAHPPRAPKLTIESRHRLVVRAGRVKAVLVCAKSSPTCAGKLSLVTSFSHSVPHGHGRGWGERGLGKVTIAHAVPYTLAAGERKTIVLKIDAKGRKLLKKAKGHKLRLWLLATYPGGRTAKGVMVALRKAHKHHERHHHHRKRHKG